MSLGGNCAYSDASGETSIFLPRYRHDDLVWVFNFLIVCFYLYCIKLTLKRLLLSPLFSTVDTKLSWRIELYKI